MSFVHDEPGFAPLLTQVADQTRIAPMFWGPRIPLDEACGTLRDWVAAMRG
ncbi:MAG: hypothetical protein KGS00_11615 [Alphaproteobacteria bacterium]|nr:hypothetical protein [Alphaproteobacteria bacterium]